MERNAYLVMTKEKPRISCSNCGDDIRDKVYKVKLKENLITQFLDWGCLEMLEDKNIVTEILKVEEIKNRKWKLLDMEEEKVSPKPDEPETPLDDEEEKQEGVKVV